MAEIDRSADRDLPLDAHLHTELSHDADVPIDVYAAAAIERGIAELAITDHLDFDPLWGPRSVDFAARERYVRTAAERWADRVAIRFGVEISYERRYEPAIRDHLRTHAYDFTIGSVHIDDDGPYGPGQVAAFCSDHRLGDVVEPYFGEVAAAARSGLFDVIGHLDFVKRYLHPHVMPADLGRAPELYEPVLAALIESGTCLEVNTSGLRQEPGETYPSPAIVARYAELGGRAVTIGSDAHRAPTFAIGLGAGYAAASAAGFGEISLIRRQASTAVAG